MVYDLSRASGSRVVSLEVLCTACRVPAYVPLQMDEIYNVTLPSYMLFGGDGYHMLKDKNLGYSKGKDGLQQGSRQDLFIVEVSDFLLLLDRLNLLLI